MSIALELGLDHNSVRVLIQHLFAPELGGEFVKETFLEVLKELGYYPALLKFKREFKIAEKIEVVKFSNSLNELLKKQSHLPPEDLCKKMQDEILPQVKHLFGRLALDKELAKHLGSVEKAILNYLEISKAQKDKYKIDDLEIQLAIKTIETTNKNLKKFLKDPLVNEKSE